MSLLIAAPPAIAPNTPSVRQPAEVGDLVGEVQVFREAGMNQLFTDQPDLGVEAVASRR